MKNWSDIINVPGWAKKTRSRRIYAYFRIPQYVESRIFSHIVNIFFVSARVLNIIELLIPYSLIVVEINIFQ